MLQNGSYSKRRPYPSTENVFTCRLNYSHKEHWWCYFSYFIFICQFLYFCASQTSKLPFILRCHSDPGAAAGEDQIRLQVRTVQATRVELVCQASVTAWCNHVRQIFMFSFSDSSVSPLSVSPVAITTLSLRSSVSQHQVHRGLWATWSVRTQTE